MQKNTDKPFRPMLATPANLLTLRFPVIASPKLDGIRGVVHKFALRSRTLKPIPNSYAQQLFGHRELEGLDGELIVGSPTAPDVFRQSTSGVMTILGQPDVTYHVFDLLLHPDEPYVDRIFALQKVVGALRATSDTPIVVHDFRVIANMDGLLAYEEAVLAQGYEGLILRSGGMPYKYGRSTAQEQGMLKLKRMETSEAVIRGVVELEHNDNPAVLNAMGLTERGTQQAHKVGAGTMGALIVEDIETGCEFALGTGFTAEERAMFWRNRVRIVGNIVSYDHFPVGAKDKPRFPSYKGFRHPMDF